MTRIRGFGFAHDGSFDTTFTFSFAPNFGRGLADPNEPLTIFPPFLGIQINNPQGLSMLPAGFPIHEALDAYMMVFESNFDPIVGQQVTLTDDNEAEASPRIDLLMARALQDECQLIARDAENEGYLFDGSVYLRNKANKPPLTEAQLRAQAHPKGAVTYTCVPKGNGYRLALDRDLNGVLDGDE